MTIIYNADEPESLRCALNRAKAGQAVHIICSKLSKKSLVLKLICLESAVPERRLFTKQLSDNEWGALTRAIQVLCEVPILINDSLPS